MANFYLGQIFGKKEEAKKLIIKHAVESRRLIKIIKDDHIRVRAVCTGFKPDFEVDDGGVHTSKGKKTKDKGASEQIEEDPNISLKAVQGQFRRKYGVSVHKMKAYRAKMKAKKKVEGDYKEQYSLLREYAAELVDKNPALNRDLHGLDGAFMKGTFPGQMLTAVGLDSNNGIYPVCYAIVESESNNSWTWFLELMSEDLEIGSNSRFTFMSDRQKGLLQAIQTLFPCDEHIYCLRHIHENMKLAGYRGRAISDVMINNMCEVYNGKIVEGRDRPIISALEYVREYLMRSIVTVLGIIDKWDGLLTPRATELFATIQNQVNHYNVQWNGGDLYEVSGKPTDPRVVNLALKTCS
ncbi:uncharacterized protein LOC143617935 [Bidens hawaiensis]|uniref:uncharacterized protein LOC143617935 n=1 Tax=Bidens hawaiensis TaxID=980011 RepID=UPI004049A039